MVRLDVAVPVGYTEEDIVRSVLSRLPIEREELHELHVLHERLLTVDGAFSMRLTVAFSASEEREHGLLKMRKTVFPYERQLYTPRTCHVDFRPVVVGAGPAGLFAALALAEAGARPLLFERGEAVEQRQQTVSRFFSEGVLQGESNIQYGEGGAGAFSDGKLKLGKADPYREKLLAELILAGAPPEICYAEMPHLGTDRLPKIVRRLREKIISLGGEVHFGRRVDRLFLSDGAVVGVGYHDGEREGRTETGAVFFATGHSAADTLRMLRSAGAVMEPRPFGIGLRTEHPREYIDRLRYGEGAPSSLGAASYHLVSHLKNGRSVYSFCMCPGGSVVAAASAAGRLVTNGMSPYARDGENSNSALLVSFLPSDFATDDPLGGLHLQEEIERAAFRVGGGGYRAPACRMEDFVKRLPPRSPEAVKPTYPLGTTPALPEAYLPSAATESLREALLDFDAWLPGFYLPSAVLTGAETRSTSPVRIVRDAGGEAVGIRGVYPIGEGAGYAGGIASSGIDGLRAVEVFLSKM